MDQDAYSVDRRYIRHVDPANADDLRRLCEAEGNQIAAVVLEPVLGTGAIEVREPFLQTLFELADRYGFYLVADEVATGYFRTGPFRASEAWSRQPDVVILSKGLTNGACAAAAVVVGASITDLFRRRGGVFLHGETQAGTPMAASAIEAVLSLAESLDAPSLARRLSEGLDVRLAQLREDLGGSVNVSGRGAFRGLSFHDDAGAISYQKQSELVEIVRDAGVIVSHGLHGFQILPALTYTNAELDELFERLRSGLRTAAYRKVIAIPALQ
jgi:adenosylmethionine-8-amino-7-oxononanoate aminotransferase